MLSNKAVTKVQVLALLEGFDRYRLKLNLFTQSAAINLAHH